jgi:hypothetical protein
MQRSEFKLLVEAEIDRLFQDARTKDELSFLFAALGFNSGEEDAGWQPIQETHALISDLVGLINSPLHDRAKVRVALFLYCHITEADYIYHCLFNMLLTLDDQQPNLFNFLQKYRKGVPPSFSVKIAEIRALATKLHFEQLNTIFDEIVRTDIRNAFFHSDYILYNGELRLKHRGAAAIPFDEVSGLLGKSLDFFYGFMTLQSKALRSFPKGYKITGRKRPGWGALASVDVLVDDDGLASGFSTSDPLPLW